MVGAGLTNMWSMYGTNDIPNVLIGYFGGIAQKIEVLQRWAGKALDFEPDLVTGKTPFFAYAAYAIPGVSGTGSPVRLEFLEPGGATTGKLLPTGNVADALDVPGVGRLTVSMIDAAKKAIDEATASGHLAGLSLRVALAPTMAQRCPRASTCCRFCHRRVRRPRRRRDALQAGPRLRPTAV